jgi:uncharacterized phage-associated protein
MTENLNLNINRERLLEALLYFSKNLKYPTKMMIFKVLAELDFRHFKETGLPVTNLEYSAWKFGPVPEVLNKEFTDKKNDEIIIPADFSNSLTCVKEDWETKKGEPRKTFKFKAKRKPNLEVFTPRQQKILEDVLIIYKTASPSTASKASHEKNTPWYITVKKKGKEGELIDYFDLLDSNSKITKEEAIEMVREVSAFQYNYSNKS